MKIKNNGEKALAFHSISSPCDFVARLREVAVNSNVKIEQKGTDFILQLGSNHGGMVVYKASIAADERGGSYISGEITTIPWVHKLSKKKSIIKKILSIIGYIVIFPFALVFFLCCGIYSLFVRLFHSKSIETTNKEKLREFMNNKMCCKQIN